MGKGEQTRAAIVGAALDIASREGLEGLTIGLLAERMGMSKSGVFAHFGSREDLQLAVVREYHRRFEEEIFYPALREPRGLARLRAMVRGWLRRHADELATGCMYISGAVEYDDRPGPIRDELLRMVLAWQDALLRAARQAVETGELLAETDCEQLVFEVRALVLGLHHDVRFLKAGDARQRAERAIDRVIAQHLASAAPASATASASPASSAAPATPARRRVIATAA